MLKSDYVDYNPVSASYVCEQVGCQPMKSAVYVHKDVEWDDDTFFVFIPNPEFKAERFLCQKCYDSLEDSIAISTKYAVADAAADAMLDHVLEYGQKLIQEMED
jgi:hypothetical protein